MKPFTKPELFSVIIILCITLGVSLFNFQASLRLARDAQRKNDMGYITSQLSQFKEDNNFVPLASEDGRIKACEPENYQELEKQFEDREISTQRYLESLRPCDWGYDALEDIRKDGKTYIERLSGDPKSEDGITYRYISNSRIFQIYSYLEGEEDEAEFNESIVNRSIPCGIVTCNFGKAFQGIPLDKSLEEYENELER